MLLLLILQLIISCCFLSYAAYKDIKTREVENNVWLLYLVFTLPIAVMDIYFSSIFTTIIYVISVAAISTISIVTFYFNGWGGADSKATICLSLSLGLYAGIVMMLALLFYFVYSFRHSFTKIKSGYNAPFLVFLLGAFLFYTPVLLWNFAA